MISWFTGLGVLAKVALAAGVAVAAVGGVGAAGALPGGTQEAFDHLVSVVVPTTDNDPGSTPTTEPSPEPTGSGESARPDNFGGTVSELAHELGEGSDGRQFGKDVSEAAQANGRSTDGTDDATEGDATQSDDGSTHPSGKPDDSPSDQH